MSRIWFPERFRQREGARIEGWNLGPPRGSDSKGVIDSKGRGLQDGKTILVGMTQSEGLSASWVNCHIF